MNNCLDDVGPWVGTKRRRQTDDEEKKETMKDRKRYRGRMTEGNDLKEPVKKKTNAGVYVFIDRMEDQEKGCR